LLPGAADTEQPSGAAPGAGVQAPGSVQDLAEIVRLRDRIASQERELAYLRALVWKLSLYGLAEQDPKYRRWFGHLHVQEMAR
jgi:hypothetical protein